MKPSDEHFVYHCLDENDVVIYVGATSHYEARVKEYDKRPDVVRIERRQFPTRAQAFAAEADDIYRLQPRWNTQGKKARR